MERKPTGLPIDAVAQIVCIIAVAWGIACGISWLIELITN